MQDLKDLEIGLDGDLVLSKHDLQLIRGKNALLQQKVRLILSTNRGEWDEEGISFQVFLGKNPNESEMLDEILRGLRQVDETFRIKDYVFRTEQRHLIVSFAAENDEGETVELALGEVGNAGTSILICATNADEILNCGTAENVLCICESSRDVLSCET